MKVKYCTITGADDQVDPIDLIRLSKKYNHAEWGILYSLNHQGTARYPSMGWIKNFIGLCMDEPRTINASLHLCGESVFKFLARNPETVNLSRYFTRVQLNKPFKVEGTIIRQLFKCIDEQRSPVVLQVNSGNRDLWMHLHSLDNFQVLFDESRGNGIKAHEYPTPFRNTLCGYAGGLGPCNLAETLRQLRVKAQDREITVDMESGVRLDNRFNLSRAEMCLQIIQGMT